VSRLRLSLNQLTTKEIVMAKGARKAEKKAERKAIFERAMKSAKVDAILAVAKQFERLTATGSAKALREHAEDVKAGRYPPAGVTPPAVVTPAPVPSADELEAEEKAAQAASPAASPDVKERLNGGTPPAHIVVEAPAASEEAASP
jgi:hypothetical protein